MKKLLIVDDHRLFADGIRFLIDYSMNYEVVDVLNTGGAVMPFLAGNKIDIFHHAGGSGKAAIMAEIRTVQKELGSANDNGVLVATQQALATCRSHQGHLPPVVPNGGVLLEQDNS